MVGVIYLPWWLATALFTIKRVPWITTHLAIMPLEPLIIFVDSSASSAILAFLHFGGDVPFTPNPSEIVDTLYLV